MDSEAAPTKSAPTETPLIERLRALLRTPTAPFREQWMIETLERQLASIPNIHVRGDAFGNRVVRLYRGRPSGRAAVFVAHLDHPGFVFPEAGARALAPNRYAARFEGRILDEFFHGSPVRLFRTAYDRGVEGRVVEAGPYDNEKLSHEIIIETREAAERARLAMWDVAVCSLRGDKLHGRACDDLAGCAALLEMLARLSDEPRIDVAVIFTRAEEAGFCGTLCLLTAAELPRLLPEKPIFISVEISSETRGVSLGDGAIIRVGDRTSTFDAAISDALWTIAQENKIHARRALMDGGTCEATAFARAGHQVGAICAPLRHYHNMDRKNGQIAAEIIAPADLEALTRLAVGLARAISGGKGLPPPAAGHFKHYLAKGRKLLKPVQSGGSGPAQAGG